MDQRRIIKNIEIQEKYDKPPNGIKKYLGYNTYVNTKKLANKSMAGSSETTYEIRYSAFTSIFNASFILSIQILVFALADTTFRKTAIHIIFQLVFGLSSIYGFYQGMRREVALRLSYAGLIDLVNGKTYEWKDILATHIFVTSTGKTTETFLKVSYYNKEVDDFSEANIDLTLLSYNRQRLATLIEHFKSKSQLNDC